MGSARLHKILPSNIIDKINNIPIPVNNIENNAVGNLPIMVTFI